MKRPTAQWVLKAEEDWQGVLALAKQKPPLRDLVCFHCQQAVEKYLKGLLEEGRQPVPKTHDLEKLLELLLPHDAKLEPLRRSLVSLTRYAVEFRYPGLRATRRRMEAALRSAKRARQEIRQLLNMEGKKPPLSFVHARAAQCISIIN